jgi:hypothetical protein
MSLLDRLGQGMELEQSQDHAIAPEMGALTGLAQ